MSEAKQFSDELNIKHRDYWNRKRELEERLKQASAEYREHVINMPPDVAFKTILDNIEQFRPRLDNILHEITG